MRALAVLLVIASACTAQIDPIASAVDKLQHGEPAAAEQILREQLRRDPGDAMAAGVLAAVLDQRRDYQEAERFYSRALAADRQNASLLNNYGNHLLAAGKPDAALARFREVVRLDPTHVNARLQLARLTLERKNLSEAQASISHLPDGVPRSALQMQLDYLLHRPEADSELARLDDLADRDPAANLLIGAALAGAERYAAAEVRFQRVVEANPRNLEALRSLGLAASHAGDLAAAQVALGRALELEPDNADSMYDLAVVDRAANRDEQALDIVARACRLQPSRPDVHRLLARLLADERYFVDAIHAWDEYIALVPGDDLARRERAFAQTAVGVNRTPALNELRASVRSHPDDPIGHYELALAIAAEEPQVAKRELDRAIELDPSFTGARIARGFWLSRQGESALALTDFQAAARRDQNNPRMLDRLAEADIATGANEPALPLLQKAADLAPADQTIALHLARAYLKAGRTQDAEQLFAKVRELRSSQPENLHSPGLLEFLKLSPHDRQEKYRSGVERAANAGAGDPEAQVRYLEVLAGEGAESKLEAVCDRIAKLPAETKLLVEAARTVLSSDRLSLACASQLIAAGLQRDRENHDLLDLQRISAELAKNQQSQRIAAKDFNSN